MSGQEAFERILASLYEAMLDDRHWPATSALIDEACGLTGKHPTGRRRPQGRHPDSLRGALLPRAAPRRSGSASTSKSTIPSTNACRACGNCPTVDWRPIRDLYTAEELKTSRTYNEGLLRGKYQNGLNVRLDGPDGSHMTWGLGDPISSEGWGSSEITMVTRLLPQIRQFVRVRQALVRAEARDTTVTTLLDNSRIGGLHLDRRGRILAANDRAGSILRGGDGLSDRDGVLRARTPAGQLRLKRLVAEALPTSGTAAVSGSMLLGRSFRVAAVGAARQTRGCPATGLRSAARSCAGVACRAGAPASYRSRPGRQGPGIDAG